MTRNDLRTARHCLSGMEQLLAKSRGGWADEESLLEFRRLCWTALLAADDTECQEEIDLLVQYAKDLYSEREHRRWDAPATPGAEILRRQIRMVLAVFRARLDGAAGYGKRWRDLRAA